MKRRKFLGTAGMAAGALAGAGLATAGAAKRPRLPLATGEKIDPRDHAYWDLVRAQFPLTDARIYLNTGGLGPPPYVVLDTVKNRMTALESRSETGHTAKLWAQVKSSAAELLACKPEELAYTRNTTEGVNIVCNGLPLKQGDEVITTTHEHVGNTMAWLARQRRDGIVVKVFEPSLASAQENVDRLSRLITSKTRVISISHITTATGQVFPVEAIGDVAHQRNIWYFVDGAQSAGMLPIDLHAMKCHAYATSGHKWLLGPKGTGLLYVRQDALDLIEAKWVGAYSNSGSFDMKTGEFAFHPTAQRYEYGTVNAPLFEGLGAGMDFLHSIGMKNVWSHNMALAAALREGLESQGATVLSPRDPAEHSSMLTFKIPEMPYAALQKYLAEHSKLRTRGIYEGGLNGLRISLHLFNSFRDVETILDGVRAARKA